MKMMKIIICEICNEPVKVENTNRRFCDTCSVEYTRYKANEDNKRLQKKKTERWNNLNEETKAAAIKRAAEFYLKEFKNEEPRKAFVEKLKRQARIESHKPAVGRRLINIKQTLQPISFEEKPKEDEVVDEIEEPKETRPKVIRIWKGETDAS